MIALPPSPIGYELDKTRIVGEVPYQLGTSPSGQVELSVPIETFASEYESSPQIALKYCSQTGMTFLGNGWSIAGLSQIEPIYNTFFTDGNVSGKDHVNGPWSLDGNRLIHQEANDSVEILMTQTGNTKVIHHLNGTGFTAYEPNGSKNRYNISSAYNTFRHISKSTAIDGKEINYSYYDGSDIKRVKSVGYGEGRTIDFEYENCQDNHTVYINGIPLAYEYKLSRIAVKRDGRVLRQYVMTYRDDEITSPLVQIDMLDSIGNPVNPLHFYYQGDSAVNASEPQTDKHLATSWNTLNADKIFSLRGKLDYATEDDAVIMFPSKRRYRISNYHKIKNDYNANDEMAINYSFSNGSTTSGLKLQVGEGFVDAFCMDFDGVHGEELIKVSQNVYNNLEQVKFEVYRLNYNSLNLVKTVSRDLSPVLCSGHRSIWPAIYLAGDFTGDGKQEVLMCRTSDPLYDEGSASMMMIDLDSGSTLYSGTIDTFQMYIPGGQFNDSQNQMRALNSDRLIATDLDGDGKMEMCVLTNGGLDIYRFSYNQSGNVVVAKSNSQSPILSLVHDYQVTAADVNGDGNTDLVCLPLMPSKTVKSYISKGDGSFTNETTNIYSYSDSQFLCFDYDQDSQTDIVRYFRHPDNSQPITRSIKVFTLKNGHENQVYSIDHDQPSVLVPMSFFGQCSNTALISIKDNHLYDIHRFSDPKTMDALLTGVADSRGCVSRMEYRQLYQGEYYSPGYEAAFPYATYAGGMFVCSAMNKTAGNITQSDLSFSYSNATVHRQGLGFLGFRSIQSTDNLRGETTTRSFSPENFGVPVSTVSPEAQTFRTYSTSITNDRRVKVLLTADSAVNNLTGVTSCSRYIHDGYGNVVNEMTRIGDYNKSISNVYLNVDTGNYWIIGAEVSQVQSLSHDNQTVVSGRSTRYSTGWLCDTIITWRGDEQHPVSTRYIRYDEYKRPDRIKTTAYSGLPLKRYFDYEGSSRIPIGISDEKGMYTTMSFGDFGMTESWLQPDRLNRVDNDEPLPILPTDPFNQIGGGDGLIGTNALINPGVNFGNPVITTCHYDALGRPDTTTVSDGTVKTIAYSWADDDPAGALTLVESTASGEPGEKTWQDALGRRVMSATQRFDGLWAKTAIQYDYLGRVSAESMPFTGNAASQWTTCVYDSFDRLTERRHPDNHIDYYQYNGLTATSTIDGETSSRTLDAAGNLVAVTDAGGTIAYTLLPDGRPVEIRVGGVIATSFEYDAYGRRTAINDPSAGRRTTAYDSDGRVSCETDARGMGVTTVYDGKGRLVSRAYSDGLTENYSYNSWNQPTLMQDNKGHLVTWNYDRQHKFSSVMYGMNGFEKTVTYDGNQVASVAYHTGNTYICTENYNRQNGHITSITLNTGDTIWTLREQDARFLPVRLGLGKLNLAYAYDLRGNVTSRSAARANGGTIQSLGYSYATGTGNMTSRTDQLNGLVEEFGYDSMNRLTDISMTDPYNSVTEQELLYDGKGNVLSRTDAGQYGYGPMLPYAMNALTAPTAAIPMREQYLHYNAMQQPDTIIENGYTATFSYYGDRSRASMTVAGPNGYQFSCNYQDQRYNYFTKTENNVTAHKTVLWLGGSPYSAPAAMLKDYGSSTWRLVHVLRDNLGSITHVVDTAGVVLQQMGYTAWGQLRDPQTGEAYGPDAQPELLLGRGYTGHEHLPWFGLVNMNARLYDPAVGRFLSPDPIVQAPDDTQNFNRYSYCMNNPLRYVDPLGLFQHTACYSRDGVLLYFKCLLDDVVIIGQRKNASMNISLNDGVYGGWTSPLQISGNQPSNNGYGNTFFGGGGGVSAQLSNDPVDWSQYHVVTSPSMPQPYWQSLINGASSLNEHLGIANGYAEFAFKNLKTADKSKLVYDFSKEIESITGNKIRNYSNIYKNVIPSAFDAIKKGSFLAGAGFVIYDAYSNQQFRASNALDLVMSGISLIPTYGLVIDGLYIGSNYFLKLYTGNTIGDFLNEWMESEYELQNGAIIK